MKMKHQWTAIASALALAVTMGVSADARDPNYTHEGNVNNTGKNIFDNQEGIRSGMDGYASQGQATGVRVSVIQQFNGSFNTANALQQGNEQYSRIRQQDGDNNQAYVKQGVGPNALSHEKNESVVLQKGDDNYANVTQNGVRNDSYIRQNGNKNTANVRQVNNSDLSDSIIFQTGENNTATVVQRDNTDETWSFISQDGLGAAGHEATITQVRADLSASYVYQDGDISHTATVLQRDEMSSLSMIRQGNNNGAGAVASHTQTGGSNNYASSLQL